MLVPDSQTVVDAPSNPSIERDPPPISGEVAIDQDSGAVDPQPIIIDKGTQMIYDSLTLVPDAVSAQTPSPRDAISSLLTRGSFTPTFTSPTAPLPAKSCLLDDNVQWSVGSILQAPVPPQQWTSDLELAIKVQLHTGARPSLVQHPTIPGLCLPLWVVKF